jgi:hypothetical protein
MLATSQSGGMYASINNPNKSTKTQVLHTVAYTLYGKGVWHLLLLGGRVREPATDAAC